MNPQKIRKELAKLRNKLIIAGENPNKALNLARKAMNDKYGHTWRNEPYLGTQNTTFI